MNNRSDYTRIGDPISEHFNSEGEKAVILKRPEGVFRGGELLLCLVDNEQTNTYAPMLLDQGTAEWINRTFSEHGKKET